MKEKIVRCNNSGLQKEARISVLTRKNRGHCSPGFSMRVSYGKLFTVSRVMTWTHLFNKGGGGILIALQVAERTRVNRGSIDTP